MKTILITGSNGFLGSHIVDQALSKKMKVYAGVRRSSDLTHLQGKNVTLVYLNYNKPLSLIESIKDIEALDIVVHNAGITVAKDEKSFDLINHQYTRNIISALISSNVSLSRFILMSSLAAVGPKDASPFSFISDNDIPNPNTSYGSSKLNAEIFLKAQNVLPYTILRPCAVYGPRDNDFLTLFKSISAGFEIYLGLQKTRLSFIHVFDLVTAVFTVIENEKAINESYLVSDGNNYTIEDLNRWIKKCLQKTTTVKIRIPKTILLGTAYFLKIIGKNNILNKDKIAILTASNWQVDTSKIQSIGFRPRLSLKEGIDQTATYLNIKK